MSDTPPIERPWDRPTVPPVPPRFTARRNLRNLAGTVAVALWVFGALAVLSPWINKKGAEMQAASPGEPQGDLVRGIGVAFHWPAAVTIAVFACAAVLTALWWWLNREVSAEEPGPGR